MSMKEDIQFLIETKTYSWGAIEALSRLSGLDIDSSGGLLSQLVDRPNGIVGWLLSENFILGNDKRLAIDSYSVV